MGEVLVSMLVDFGCMYVILGYFECRVFFFEMDEFVVEKFVVIFEGGLILIFCLGEFL